MMYHSDNVIKFDTYEFSQIAIATGNGSQRGDKVP